MCVCMRALEYANSKQPFGFLEFYVLLTVHLSIILVNDQLDAQFFFLCVYFNSLHVSSNLVLIIRRINCINTITGMCHSVYVTVHYARRDLHNRR
jgi:hypothetical protein